MEFWTRLTFIYGVVLVISHRLTFEGFHPSNAVWSSCEPFDLFFRPPLGLSRPCVFE